MREGCFRYIAMAFILILVGGGPCAAANADDAPDDVGYSTGPSEQDAPVTRPAPATAKDTSPKPALSITLDRFESPAPEPKPAPRSAPEAADTATARPRASQRPAVSGRSESPAPPARQQTSPILAMIESTLHGRYAETVAIKLRLPPKTFGQTFDHAGAHAFSRKANILLNKQHDLPGALDSYAQAYARDKSSSEINGSYGYALYRSGHFPEARDLEIESLEIRPGYGAAWFVLGQIFGALNQENEAYACFVNTCLFTKNMSTTQGYLEREMEKNGPTGTQHAAARALTTCRQLPR